MQQFPWFRFSVFASGLMAIGYIAMKATTPTEEQLYKEMSPDLRRRVDATRNARLTREAELKKQMAAQEAGNANPETSKPIWADPPSK
ncbi:hypothetical protein AGABI1DRAFT_111539 [Agaricus bisporus var. burnettii JB137-S8]|uniref:Assembly factor CBP4 n=1 Tax=Agaricus bisporus var. burnettii (strain JB137-S8 / ATCC MYA-4627 / FGSC 10392) TaxID=597362 RepID=K5XHS2_AGABU|nr:uncharacterized protein AGABI1DRAFT_111539 [Agaricus bisporus var. burnettii JB137-S8]EKM83008.1 hypothetical protein AGABI1DRAFT_111539 [Agaricus bisporus var. burnettii JB137-S8]